MKRRSTDYDLSTATWHKSSYSGGSGGDCVEVATWRKSTYSGPSGGDCLEVLDGIPNAVPRTGLKDDGRPGRRLRGHRLAPLHHRPQARLTQSEPGADTPNRVAGGPASGLPPALDLNHA